MRQFFLKMLQNGSPDSISSKRVIAFGGFLLMAVAFLVDLFTDYTVSQSILDAIDYLTIASLGFTAAERFAQK